MAPFISFLQNGNLIIFDRDIAKNMKKSKHGVLLVGGGVYWLVSRRS